MRTRTVLAVAVLVLCAGLAWSQFNAFAPYQYTDGSTSPETLSWAGGQTEPYPDGFTVYSNAAFFMKRTPVSGTEDPDSFQIRAATGFTSVGLVSALIFYGQSDTIDCWPWYR